MIKEDALLLPRQGGVILAEKALPPNGQGVKLKQLLSNPYSVYLLNLYGETLAINDFGADVCGYISSQKAKGKSLFDVATKDSATTLLKNSQTVLTEKKLQFFDEIHQRKDDISQSFLSIKLPCFNHHQELVGSLGFSIVLGKNNLSESLASLTNLGFLQSPAIDNPNENKQKGCDIYLTCREKECITLSLKHYSAKEIAKVLGISYRTVEEYLSNIKQKFGVSTKKALLQKVRHFWE